jgi:flavodoxin
MKSVVIVFSYHHGNTAKVAGAIAGVLGAEIKEPKQVRLDELGAYDLVGLGSGIYDEKHHTSLLDLVDSMPPVKDKKTFIFSTCSLPSEAEVARQHSILRDRLLSKGHLVIGEFSCRGFNTNSFLRHFGGMNKGRPNAEDLTHAEEFARDLKQKMEAL